jgi:serine protease Do
MRLTASWRAISVAALVLAGCAARAQVQRLEEDVAALQTAQQRSDFARVINAAKRKVFPVIVYLKPIQETFEAGAQAEREIIGTGVVISPDGYVVTNYHVARKATRIRAVLANEKQVTVSLVGEDQDTDIALLKLDLGPGAQPVPYATFGDSSQLEEGDFVMTMGCPLGLTRSVSLGIVSNTKRYLGADLSRYTLWIQTDAAINPGNSGGPLVNTNGQIVGITTLGAMSYENIGFAIPSNLVKTVVAELMKHSKLQRSWTGITFQALKDFERNTVVDADRGVLVAHVDPGSPAADAGLLDRDLILGVNGQAVDGVFVEDLPQVRGAFALLPFEREAVLSVQREGKPVTLRLKPVLKGEVEGKDFDCKEWQMTIKEINRFADRQIYYFRKEGVYVRGVKYPGNAQNSGVQAGDILLEVGGQEITSLQGASRMYADLNEKPMGQRKVLLKVLRGGVPRLIVLEYSKRDAEYEEEK